ncbi:MAG TPA: hypothetical protein VGD62_03420 [Acidobacteriaceae bacterium]
MFFIRMHAAAMASILTPIVCASCWVFLVLCRCDNCGLKIYERLAVIPLSFMIAFDLWMLSFCLRW